jgi:hypothetical protein
LNSRADLPVFLYHLRAAFEKQGSSHCIESHFICGAVARKIEWSLHSTRTSKSFAKRRCRLVIRLERFQAKARLALGAVPNSFPANKPVRALGRSDDFTSELNEPMTLTSNLSHPVATRQNCLSLLKKRSMTLCSL